MGEGRDQERDPGQDEDPIQEWLAMVGTDEILFEGEEDSFGGPPPSLGPHPVAFAPMIVDTDAGGDPDDSVAIVAAARSVPELALVVTSDEYGGERARFVRHLLDLAGRPEVPVVAGAELQDDPLYFVDGLFPQDVPKQSEDLLGAVETVCASTPGPVRWVGMGPLSNLAALQEARPELVAKMVVTQMGGAVNYRDPSRAEHNFRMDPAAVTRMLPVLELSVPTFVVSEVTFNPAMEILPASPIYRKWTEAGSPPWAPVLRAHLDRWMQRYPASMQHDSLTLAAAVLWPGVRFVRERVALDPLARMTVDAEGIEIALSIGADYESFMGWLEARVT
ncbi:nucleoside hydrolase [Kribbella italica]|uniref:Inosine-uridine nucleoside N-ribohydrolase n=1 Tax=Kribbella italica TaxID=1540520 RepID=A0A7W9J5T6_9ACTN|nr:nucleoside hydrolase [Kribbella italica]MBB5835423.1 inosine-uridine nucleoside N-ribohydrolase [Kribbella italica]